LFVRGLRVDRVPIADILYYGVDNQLSNGEWTGVTEWLRNGSVDTTMQTYYLTSVRFEAFAFTNVFDYSHIGALYAVQSSSVKRALKALVKSGIP
jgi:hypothetical protein